MKETWRRCNCCWTVSMTVTYPAHTRLVRAMIVENTHKGGCCNFLFFKTIYVHFRFTRCLLAVLQTGMDESRKVTASCPSMDVAWRGLLIVNHLTSLRYSPVLLWELWWCVDQATQGITCNVSHLKWIYTLCQLRESVPWVSCINCTVIGYVNLYFGKLHDPLLRVSCLYLYHWSDT